MKRKERIELYREKAEQYQARADRDEAKEKVAERKRETRRKILMGAAFQHAVLGGVSSDAVQELISCLSDYITANNDRELLGLAVIHQTENTPHTHIHKNEDKND